MPSLVMLFVFAMVGWADERDLVVFDEGRSSFQVQGCADGVIAIHIPLSSSQLEAVRSVE